MHNGSSDFFLSEFCLFSEKKESQSQLLYIGPDPFLYTYYVLSDIMLQYATNHVLPYHYKTDTDISSTSNNSIRHLTVRARSVH